MTIHPTSLGRPADASASPPRDASGADGSDPAAPVRGPRPSPDRSIEALAARVIEHADGVGAGHAPTPTGVDGLTFVRASSCTTYEPLLYEPLACVVLQGEKETTLGNRVVRFAAGESLIVSFDLPSASRIRRAGASTPYVALALRIDMGVVRDLLRHPEAAPVGAPDGRGAGRSIDSALVTGPVDPALLDAMRRLFDLVGRPEERPVMLPLLVREVHFRLLRTAHGGMLRRLAAPDGHAARIAQAVARLRRDYATDVSVAELARTANMSVSSFHEHFKSITATTPVQFRKALRLLAARDRLLAAEPVTSVALEIGYRSPAHFSRDYARHFGRPPVEDRRAPPDPPG